jgi:beta-phosphoglucomutase-like phosphatase (HAD superfamily)
MTGDGDFDAEKILSSIGPRPTRTKSNQPTAENESSGQQKAEKTDALSTNVNPSDVTDSLYRSVAAAGGGRVKENEELQQKEKAEFADYLAKEEEMRQRLDRLDEDAAEVAKSMDGSIDDPAFAQNVLASIGSRPVFKRKAKNTIDERKLSDMGGVLASREIDVDVDDSSDEDDNDSDVSVDEEAALDDIVPAWLKKEREAAAKSREESDGSFLGSDIDEVFDDDQYEHNLRQLHEYEQRRSGRKQMGIDISDIFGRRGSDDYVDYTYDTEYFRHRQDGWGATSFQARKRNLLEYIELDVSELNSLMAQIESVYTTGVSQYLPRINKPFKEFGAIFRLEGVLLDITGLQHQVWKRVATEFDFKEPLSEDIQRAAVVRPDIVVREIFFGTNDIIMVRKVADAYRRIFREEFEIWVEEEGIILPEVSQPTNNLPSEQGSLAIGSEEMEPVSPPSPTPTHVTQKDEEKRLKQLKERWTKTANQFGYPPPSNEQIAQCSMVTPDIAVRSIFEWTHDQNQIDQVVYAYSITQAGELSQTPDMFGFDGMPSNNEADAPKSNPQEEITESMLLELQYMAWKKVAEENALDPPYPEEVLAAAAINDPEAVVMSGFGWSDDFERSQSLAGRYREVLTQLVNDRFRDRSLKPPEKKAALPKPTPQQTTRVEGPTDEEILSSQIEAWQETARIHNFKTPEPGRIQLVMNMNPSDAVLQLLSMDLNVDESTLRTITETYTEGLKKSLKKYLSAYGRSRESQSSSSPKDNSSGRKSKNLSEDEIYQTAYDAWTSIAWKEGFSMPGQEQIQYAMTVGPEQAILTGFRWTDSEDEAKKISQQYLDQIKVKLDDWKKRGYTVGIEKKEVTVEPLPKVRVLPGVGDWIKSLHKVEMGCGVVSHLEQDHVKILLEYAGLSDLFSEDVRVSHSNGYQRDNQQLLGAALRIERRPDHCVAFDTSPYASVAAHDVDMRSVSLVGPYPRYELLSADTSAVSIDELTAMNIRRLFGERVYDQPMLEDLQNRPETKKRVKTKYEWDEE